MKSPRSRYSSGSPSRTISPGKGGRTRGWRADSPKKGRERHSMRHRCPECFLVKPEGFPVCDKNCNYDCRGVTAAKVRAGQYHYPEAKAKAERLEKELGCPSPKRRSSRKRKTPKRRRSHKA